MRFRISISLNPVIHSAYGGCLNYFLLLGDFGRVGFLSWAWVTRARIYLLLFNFVLVKVGGGRGYTVSLVVIPLLLNGECLRLTAVALPYRLELSFKFGVT